MNYFNKTCLALITLVMIIGLSAVGQVNSTSSQHSVIDSLVSLDHRPSQLQRQQLLMASIVQDALQQDQVDAGQKGQEQLGEDQDADTPKRTWLTWYNENIADPFNIVASLNLDFLGQGGDARSKKNDDLKHAYVREIEFSLAADLTPDIWADGIFAVSRDYADPLGGDEFSMAVEELYISFLSLPFGLQGRVGKFRANFGKVNRTHPHALTWVDVPLANETLLGELVGFGGSLNYLLPFDQYSEISVEVLDVARGHAVGGVKDKNWMQIAHARTVFDLSDASTLDVGVSGGIVKQRNERHTTMQGVDLTYKWQPIGQERYKGVTWQTEAYATQTDHPAVVKESCFGAYTSVENRFSRRWLAGVLLDYSEDPFNKSSGYGVSPFITFQYSERLYARVQYHRTWNDPLYGGINTNEISFQLNISLGRHRAHIY